MTGTIEPIVIAGRKVGPGQPPFVIAEMSANHGGDFERALKIIRLAADCGADAIKFQAYRAETMTLDCEMPGFVIAGDNPWAGRKFFDLYASAATPYEWFPKLFEAARKAGITPFASPFDEAAVEMLESLDAPAYKIASFEAVDLELIARCAATGKPLIVSTGMADEEEVDDALAAARAAGGSEIALLKCTSAYPSDPAEANLLTIPEMAARFGVPVGLSDHTIGVAVATAACALGASIVEKHFIDASQPETADSTFSALPADLTALVRACREAHEARGAAQYGPAPRERESLAFRRSLYAAADISAGSPITRENVRVIRPGHGLKPKHLGEVLGRRAKRDIRRGEPLSWRILSP